MRYHEQRIPLRQYVKGVLPNEMGRAWDMDALKAGAIAVKNYAVSQMIDGKGWVYDCTWDQVYDPTTRSSRTDMAVDLTWDYWLVDEAGLVRTYYNAWNYGCAIRNEDNCMGQWNALLMAEADHTWRQILNYYYEGDLIWLGVEHGLKKEWY